MEAASNFAAAVAADCARMPGAFMTPTTTGAASAAIAAAARAAFFPNVSLSATRLPMIASILLCKSDPVTPDTQPSGDST